MNEKETRAVIRLANAATLDARAVALGELLHGARLQDHAKSEFRSLLEETKRAKQNPTIREMQALMLRPKATPSSEALTPLAAGEEPFLDPDLKAELDEWLAGWNATEALRAAGIPTPGPMLLSGTPGTGKTTTTRYVGSLMSEGRASVVLEAHSTVHQFMGEAGARISRAFTEAAECNALLVIEELDALGAVRKGITGDRSGADQENLRMSVSLMRMFDAYADKIPILATTNRMDIIDPALFRRFEYRLQFRQPPRPVIKKIYERQLACEISDEKFEWFITTHDMELGRTLPMARRARRTAFLSGRDPVEVLVSLLQDGAHD